MPRRKEETVFSNIGDWAEGMAMAIYSILSFPTYVVITSLS